MQKKKHFLENIYNPFLEEKLNELENNFSKNRKDIKARLAKCFQEIFLSSSDIIDFEVSYIVCTILRSDILDKKYVCTIMVYDEKFYISKGIKIGEVDFSEIYKYYEECHSIGIKTFRQYVGALNEADIKEISMSNLKKFNEFVERSIRYSLYEILELKEYQQLPKGDKFQFIVGEYFEFTTIVHRENKNKICLKLKDKLESKKVEDIAIVSEDFRELKFENITIESKDLSFSNFNYGGLKKVAFRRSRLIGTRLTNCKLEEVSFYQSDLSEIDFRNTKFTNCLFREVVIYSEDERNRYVEANFTNCDFKDVSFVECIFNGVDFTDSNIENVEIIGTRFERCIFDESKKGFLKSINAEILDNNFFI